MSTLSFLASLSGLSMGASGIPQLIKVFRRKSSKDISKVTYLVISSGALIWLLYGIELMNIPLIMSNGLGLIVNIGILIFTFKY